MSHFRVSDVAGFAAFTDAQGNVVRLFAYSATERTASGEPHSVEIEGQYAATLATQLDHLPHRTYPETALWSE